MRNFKVSSKSLKSETFFTLSKHNFSYILNTNIPKFNQTYVELRSDVKTMPTKKMRESVLSAVLGDDASGEDPTVNKLCDYMCNLFGKEKAIFVPTGTMSNILALGLYTPRDSYVLQGARSHLHKMEIGGQTQMGFKPFPLREIDELKEDFNLEEILRSFEKDVKLKEFSKKVKIIAFENTHNYNGGKIMSIDIFTKNVLPYLKNSEYFNHIKIHLDGSRVLNAAAALKIDPKNLVKGFDSINICLSKGLGAPCGSILLLNESDYAKAKDLRKNIGGAMRQAGFLAAPALVALEDWRKRFEIDHSNAKILAEELNQIKGLKVNQPDTNIVNIYLDETFIKNEQMISIVEKLEMDYKVLVRNFDANKYIRAVVHHQVTKEQILYTVESFKDTLLNFI